MISEQRHREPNSTCALSDSCVLDDDALDGIESLFGQLQTFDSAARRKAARTGAAYYLDAAFRREGE
jgi:hypothetical protein